MGKKKGWITYVKRFFKLEPKPKSEEKPKKWRWFHGMFNFSQAQRHEIEAPRKALIKATEEQRKRAVAVAVAAAAAAEAAVAAARSAAKVVRLASISHDTQTRLQNMAATKIQSSYRGHLARQALSALKGLVKLQAVIRGELVRVRVIKSLASMYLLSSEQPRMLPQPSIHRSCDLSLAIKDGLHVTNHEAMAKRDRLKRHSLSHEVWEMGNGLILQESVALKEGRKSSRFDHRVEFDKHRVESTHPYTASAGENHLKQLKLRTARRQEQVEETSSPSSLPRRSFGHAKHRSIGEDGSLPNTPVFPTYMAATESAKAKSRSLSTPRQRLRLCNSCSGQNSPYKMIDLSSSTSFMG